MTRTKPRVRARPKPPPVAEVVALHDIKAVKIVAQIKTVYEPYGREHNVKYWVMMAETGRTFVKAFKTKKSAIAHAKKELYRYKVFNIDPDSAEDLVEDTNDDAEAYGGHDGGEGGEGEDDEDDDEDDEEEGD